MSEPSPQTPPPGRPAPVSVLRRSLRLLRWLLLILFLLAAVLVGLVALFLYHEGAGRWVLEQVDQRVPQLSLQGVQGTLGQGLSLETVAWRDEGLRVELDGVQGQWRLECLLESAFCIDRLEAARVAVWTAPSPEDANEPEEPFEGLHLPEIRLPLQLNVGQLGVGRFTLQSGDQRPLDFGAMELSGVVAGTDWALHRVAWRFADERLGRGDLELTGYLATRGQYPVRAELWGGYQPPGAELPFRQWRLDLDGDLADLAARLRMSGDGAALLQVQADLTRAEIPFKINLETEAPVRWRELRVESALLALTGDLRDYQVRIDTRLGWADQPEVDLHLTGQGNTESLRLSPLRAQVDEARVELAGLLDWRNGVAWDGWIRLDRFDPSAWAADWPGRLQGGADTQFAWRDGQWSLKLDGLSLDGLLREQPLRLRGGLSRDVQDQWLVRGLDLAWAGSRVQAQGRVDRSWSLAGSLDLPDLSPFAPDLAGALQGNWRLGGTRADPRLHLDLTGPRLAFGEQEVRELALRARLAILTLADLDLEASIAGGQVGEDELGPMELSASGSRERHQVGIRTRFQGYQLEAALAGGFQGPAGASLAEMDWRGELRDVRLAREGAVGAWAMSQPEPAALSWLAAERRVQLAPWCLRDSQARLCASLDYALAESRLALTTDIDDFPLERLRDLLDPHVAITGKLTADAQLETLQGQSPRVRFDGGLRELVLSRIGERELPEPFRVARLGGQAQYQEDGLELDLGFERQGNARGQLKGRVRQLSASPELDLALVLERLSLGELAQVAGFEGQVGGMAEADLHVQGGLPLPRIQGQLQVRQARLALGSEGEKATPAFDRLDLEARFAGQTADLELSLTAPEHLSWKPEAPAQLNWTEAGRLRLLPSCWLATDSRLCLEASWRDGQQVQAQVELNSQAAVALGPLLPEGLALQGGLRLLAELTLNQGQEPDLKLSTSLSQGQIQLGRDQGGALNYPLERLELTAELRQRRLHGQLDLASDALGQGNAKFELPLDLEGAVAADWQLQGLQLALAKPFLPRLNELGGELSLAGQLGGSFSEPLVDGQVRLRGAHFASPALPLAINGMDVDVQIARNQVSLSGAFESGAGKGALAGEGYVGADWWANLKLSGQDLPLVARPEIDLVTQPALELRVRPQEVFLGGQVEVSKGKLELKPLPANAVEVSRDVVFIDKRDERKVAEKPWRFNAQLTLILSEQVRLSGFGADIRMAGSVTLIQDQRDVPIGRGTLEIREGRYERFGQRFLVRRGQIIFNGPLANPFVNLEAIREAGEVTAGLRLTGSLDAPQISLFSEPVQLPDETIMHYLLTGNAPGAGVGDDEALANRALLSLGLYGGTPLAEELAERFGVEQFDISTSGQGDSTAVNVSGYLTPRLFLQYGIGVFSPVNTLTLRYRLRPRLFVEAVSGVENVLDILYSFDF